MIHEADLWGGGKAFEWIFIEFERFMCAYVHICICVYVCNYVYVCEYVTCAADW